ncbi:MAG: BNR repeat-containing protein [Akkermansiaceae bacterium]|jgi:hypothetical protein|nr:BNR repeat-containing protein [Akkermansiaceae bacterium]
MKAYPILAALATVLAPISALAALEIHEVAPDGAWTWFNDERAIWQDGRIQVGYVRGDGQVAVTCYDPETRKGVETPLSSWKEKDDHDNPGFWIQPDGRILAAYATHGTKQTWNFRIAKGRNPGGPEDWGAEQTVDLTQGGKFRGGWTYCNLYQAGKDELYLFGRAINWNPTFTVSRDQGETWSEPTHLIRHKDRPYFKYASNGKGRIDVTYTEGHPRMVDNSVYHIYLENGKWHRSDGALLEGGPPFDPQVGTCVYRFGRDHPKGRAWVWDLNYDEHGSPVIAHTVRFTNDPDDLRYYHATWDAAGKTWKSVQIAKGGERLFKSENDYAGGIVLDSGDTNRVFISTALDPRGGAATPKREIYEGRRAADGTWSWTAITQDSPADNLRPYVPENHGRKTCVLWFRGSYRTFIDYDCQVMMALE